MGGFETVFDSVPIYLLSCAVLIVAQMIYVLLGFGSGLIAVGVLAMVLPEIHDVVVLLLLVNLPAEAWVVWSSRKDITWRGVVAICVGVAAGVPVGTWLLKHSAPTVMLLVLGAFLIVAGGVFLLAPHRKAIQWPKWVGPPVGLFSGVLGGAFGTGGPPLILYYQLAGVPKAIFRGNLMAIFLLVTLVRVPSYVVSGLVTPPRLWSGLAVLPAVAVGAWLGNRIHLRLPEPTFKKVVSVALMIIGAMVLLRQLLP